MSIIVLLFLLVVLPISAVHAQVKIAQTGFQFLSIIPDARAAAMGEAMTTVQGYSNSMFFNPAAMARMNNSFDINLSQNNWIADIKHEAISLALSPSEGKYGVFGFSLLSVDYGKIQGTMVWDNQQGYIDTEVFQPSALAFGLGYAKALSDRFSVGGHIKSTYQYLGKSVIPTSDTTNTVDKNFASAVAFDFGTIYLTGWKGLAFGMSVRNFSEEIKYQSEGFQLPLTFKIGISLEMSEWIKALPSTQSFLLSIDATHPRSYTERLNVGLEYKPISILALRAGYLYNYDERNYTAGFGLKKKMGAGLLGIDYAYTPFGVFDNVQRMSIQLAF